MNYRNLLNSKIIKIGLFLIILLSAFVVRLYRINFPLADWHSWRQADTSAVSRNFVKYGVDLLHPQFDDLSNVPSGKENPNGYRFVEFPIYNLMQFSFYKIFPIWGIEVAGRLVSILCTIATTCFLFLIVKKHSGFLTAILTALFFSFLPYSIYYGRVVLPEPLMLTVSTGMIYFFDLYSEDNQKKTTQSIWLTLFFIFSAATFLVKPYAAIVILPIAYLAISRWKFNFKKYILPLIVGIISVLPFIWWRKWMSQYPEGIPAFDWLFNKDNVRFKGAFFYWIFAERIGKLILGYWGLILLSFGIVIKPLKDEGLFYFSWLLGVILYFFIIAGGNVQHDYYQILTLPIIGIFLGKGASFLIINKVMNKIASFSLLLVTVIFVLSFSWYQVRDYFNINNQTIIDAGQEVNRIVPSDAKVIAPYSGDTAFLYQTNRQGWPVGIEIDKMIKFGAQYYVNFNFGPETDWLESKYCVMEKTANFVIIDLKSQCQ